VVTTYRLEAYGDVITIWRDAVARQPENVRATINLGCALQDAGRYQEAIEQFERAITIDPTRPDVGLAHRSLGMTWARLGQPEKAIHHLQVAMRLRPDIADDHAALGSLLLDVHRFPEAVQQLELAVRQQPGDVLALANLASGYAVVRTPSPPPRKRGRWPCSKAPPTGWRRWIPGSRFTAAASRGGRFSRPGLGCYKPSVRRCYLTNVHALGGNSINWSAPWAESDPRTTHASLSGTQYPWGL
jgi:tetratricopeptide (TPR) repeat protein